MFLTSITFRCLQVLVITSLNFANAQMLNVGTNTANKPLANSASSNFTANSSVQTAERPSKVNVSVPEIARLVTVRIFTNLGMGAGVIIARQGQTYTVLTCEHVVADSRDNHYNVLTADGRSHRAIWQRLNQFGNLDLALVQFNSVQSYRVAEMGSKALAVGDIVYASGFPNWHWLNEKTIEDTRNWGPLAFKVTRGTVGMLPTRSLPRGYSIGYTNDVENGMSGGPVLNSNGQVIGINGRLKYPLQGIDAYIFADGSVPSQEFFEQMEALSWAIPITSFQQTLKQQFGPI